MANPVKRKKGKSLLALPDDYCVIDIETTGLSPAESEIIEIAAVKYRNSVKCDVFTTLVHPQSKITPFITRLTGISDSMVKDAPDIKTAILDFSEFAGNDILMGYNVNFDINFLYDSLMNNHNMLLKNNFIDVLRFARKALPELENHSQTSVAAHYEISISGAHRAERDCDICNACYQKLRMDDAVIEMCSK